MTKVLKLEVVIVNHDNMTEEEVREVLEHTRYPNWCISPKVVAMESREVEWSDEHPLNNRLKFAEAYKELFETKQ